MLAPDLAEDALILDLVIGKQQKDLADNLADFAIGIIDERQEEALVRLSPPVGHNAQIAARLDMDGRAAQVDAIACQLPLHISIMSIDGYALQPQFVQQGPDQLAYTRIDLVGEIRPSRSPGDGDHQISIAHHL